MVLKTVVCFPYNYLTQLVAWERAIVHEDRNSAEGIWL